MAPAPPAQLLWRCRRGMKELDLLLERFAREHYAAAPPAQRDAFERLLALPDPLLVELLLGGVPLEAPGSSTASGASVSFAVSGASGLSGPSGEPPSAAAEAVAADPELARVAALVAAPGHR